MRWIVRPAHYVAILVDDGKLGWDDKVRERLPGFSMYDPYVSAEVNLVNFVFSGLNYISSL